jgi:retron-type reverse transcriptase
MKTYKNLYPRIWAYENLYEAWRNAARVKRKARGVAAFEYALTDRLLELEEELRTQTYRPGAYRHFRITSPKPRRISAAPFRDRVVHHALMQQIGPIFEARFSRDSYACRIGKGTRRCNAAKNWPSVTHMCCSAMWCNSFPPYAMLRAILCPVAC